ncbi:MAG: cytochrome c maturation protein CcmE [Pseudomonadota bacterium]
MRARSQRVWLIAVAGVLLAGATALTLTALRDTVTYFYGPSEIVEKSVAAPGVKARIGGLVGVDSIAQAENAVTKFDITDGVHIVPVLTREPLPDLFEEGQGVVVEGAFGANGVFEASRVLARHDENYMPREVYDALREAGGEAAVNEALYGSGETS